MKAVKSSAKGLVLAAGLGTRLRPITDFYPKPLIPFLGASPLLLSLWRFEKAGIRSTAVNTHFKAEQVTQTLSKRPFGLEVRSFHEPEILGTGGVYNPLRTWLGTDDLIVINGDVVADFDIQALLSRHRAAHAIATMALLPSVVPGESPVFHRDGKIIGIGTKKEATPAGAMAGNFACAQVLSSKFLDLLPKSGAFDVITKGYQVALSKGLSIGAYLHKGIWHDMRDPGFYWAAVQDVATDDDAMTDLGIPAIRSALGFKELGRGRRIFDSTCRVASDVKWDGICVLEPGAEIQAGCQLSNVLILPGGRIAAGTTLSDAIVLPTSATISLK